MRMRRLAVLLGVIALIGLSTILLLDKHGASRHPEIIPPSPHPPSTAEDHHSPAHHNVDNNVQTPIVASSHPIMQLINNSSTLLESRLSKQSKTLSEAVEEYKRRYGMRPPPNFDMWFKFAQNRGVKLIDEFDTIYHSLLPFWALPPKVVRQRAKEAIGFDNALLSLLIRNGKVTKVDGGGEGLQWKREALVGMLEPFVRHLPDMDLAFNIHDEPRVVVPSEDLQRLVSHAKDKVLPRSLEVEKPLNAWSKRPADMNKGDRIDEVRTTRFNRFAHQATWTHSRMSCPVDSPARDLDDDAPDDTGRYASGELGFLRNLTAFSDICLSPSLRSSFGFFDRPNALDIVSDLFPVFSESKVSSFQDILYPSPWYWSHRVQYEPEKDVDWKAKKGQMYWRGSTTGGFSRAGGWRRQHRQLFVKNINGQGKVKVMEKVKGGDSWVVREAPSREYKDLFDVKFSHIGQCDPEDCTAQTNFFEIAEPADQQDAWKYKYLVDIDGNAFSGRFYAFLLSNSLVYKFALFREWHNEWLYPWVHYVPLSLKGPDHFETVRFFAHEPEGQRTAVQIAEQSQQWAKTTLRNEDLEVWFFRLLLE
jgi:hypothetical protein